MRRLSGGQPSACDGKGHPKRAGQGMKTHESTHWSTNTYWLPIKCQTLC